MAEHHEQHWTGDEDLLDRYLREEVDHADREALEVHLAMCDECRRRVEEERAMLRGVRVYARKQLKADVQAMLAARRSGRVSVYRWIGIAATLVLAVAVWYIPGDTPDMPHQDEVIVDSSSEAEPELKTIAPGADADVGRSVTSGASRPVPEPGRSEDARARDAAAGAGLPSIREDIAAEREEAVAEDRAAQREQSAWTVAAKREIERYAPLPAPAAAAQAAEADNRRKALLREDHQASAAPGIIVRQLPFFEADRQVQALVGGSDSAVPARLEQVGDSLYVTLFPFGPIDESELRAATVRQIGRDSVQIRVGSQDYFISLRGLTTRDESH